jgi:hypothetical protein
MMKSPPPNDPENIPDLPWTIEADMIGTIQNIPDKEAFDLVILRYLRYGDTRPLAWWLHEGHSPNAQTLDYIAHMLQPSSSAPIERFPFELIAKSRSPKPGRPKKVPEKNLRDWLIYKNVCGFMERIGPGSYEAAIAEISSFEGLERSTVKRAYENIKIIIEAYDTGG